MGSLKQDETEIPNGWHIHGNLYDLTSFLDNHPGGKEILLISKGKYDATNMFESYHSFADFDYIKQKLEDYKIGKSPIKPKYTFKQNDFYDVVKKRVRNHFGTQKSLTDKVK